MISNSQLTSSRNTCLTKLFKVVSVNRKHSTNPWLKTKEEKNKKERIYPCCSMGFG